MNGTSYENNPPRSSCLSKESKFCRREETSDLACHAGALAEGDKGGVAPTVDAQTGAADVSVGLEAAVAKLQDYCNGTEALGLQAF